MASDLDVNNHDAGNRNLTSNKNNYNMKWNHYYLLRERYINMVKSKKKGKEKQHLGFNP